MPSRFVYTPRAPAPLSRNAKQKRLLDLYGSDSPDESAPASVPAASGHPRTPPFIKTPAAPVLNEQDSSHSADPVRSVQQNRQSTTASINTHPASSAPQSYPVKQVRQAHARQEGFSSDGSSSSMNASSSSSFDTHWGRNAMNHRGLGQAGGVSSGQQSLSHQPEEVHSTPDAVLDYPSVRTLLEGSTDMRELSELIDMYAPMLNLDNLQSAFRMMRVHSKVGFFEGRP